SAAYRRGQEDMRARADEAAIDMQKSASLFATTAECVAYNGACRDSAHAIRALEIKEAPGASPLPAPRHRRIHLLLQEMREGAAADRGRPTELPFRGERGRDQPHPVRAAAERFVLRGNGAQESGS